jgi:PAS domain S-box-containing protein
VPDSQPAGPVLILTPTGRDASCAQHLLTREDIDCRVCPSLDALCDALDDAMGAVLVADEALDRADTTRLTARLSSQEPWSDLPFVVLTQPVSGPSAHRSLADAHLPEVLGNVMFLERPLQALTLVSAVRAALRARRRQRQVRSHLAERTEAAERLRLIVENARDYAILITDPQDLITGWFPGAAAVFGWSADEMIGRPGSILFTPEDREVGEPEKETNVACTEGIAPNVRWHLRKDGGRVFLDGQTIALRYPDGRLRGFLKIGQDITERRAAQEQLARSEALFRTLATGIQQLVFLSRPDGSRTWVSPQWIEFTGLSLEESVDFGWLAAIHPEDREQTRHHWAAAQALGDYYIEHRVCRANGGAYRWHQTRARPFDPESRTTSEWVGASTDVHDLRELQEHQAVLVAELQHRTRNLIAVVRSLADRTLADSPFLDQFRGRLAALARVQGLFSRKEAGQKATFDELIRMELTGLGAIDAEGHRPQVTLDGPKGVRLRSAMVQTLALALHELATNAVKYGALARPEGRLVVRWRVEHGADAEAQLQVVWQESGVAVPLGPEGQPLRKGYGRELIERALPYQLGARTTYALTPEGVRCTITLPLSPQPKETENA